MPSILRRRLRAGRSAELAQFRSALTAAESYVRTAVDFADWLLSAGASRFLPSPLLIDPPEIDAQQRIPLCINPNQNFDLTHSKWRQRI